MGRNKIAGIYRWIVHRLDKPDLVYVGQSRNINKRKEDHLKSWISKRIHTNKRLRKAVIKYGMCNVEFEIVEYTDVEDLTSREIFWYDEAVRLYGRQNVANVVRPGENPMFNKEVRSRYNTKMFHIQNSEEYHCKYSKRMYELHDDTEFNRKRIEGAVTKSARTYYIITPDGTPQVVYNLSAFCRDNSLSINLMLMVISGKQGSHKGYKRDNTKYEGDSFTNHASNRAKSYFLISPNGHAVEIKNSKEFSTIYGIDCRRLSDLIYGRINVYKGWKRDDSKYPPIIKKNKKKVYRLINPEGVCIEINNIKRFCIDNNLRRNCISLVLSGRQLSHKGWTLYKE